ncbi:MAG: RluA family pseudouridine synthase [Candidatus Taylorbacteria bacterium]|nr:RluA family pseudouridine synthase [Candidatus Taylorbacteria bacterium]
MNPLPQIVYEDNEILVVNKPAGLITHQKNIDDKQPSVVDWVIQNYPELKEVGEPFIASGAEVPRAGIVHRLDKETSGLLLIAKNETVFEYMKKQFQDHTIKKHYYALVFSRPKESSGIINAPLGRIGMKRTTQMTGKKLIDGKESVTEYKTIRNFPAKGGSASGGNKFTLLDVSPKTGRTHQIRVHLKSIGCPVVGDKVYAPKGWQQPKGLDRLFLHAYKLGLITPTGKALTLETDLPEDLAHVLEKLD